ncbi:MAG TPA: high-potential iron-sulfur protein [Gammaproteobacteria bacterium]|nr:high-potential iron-sulfur protein [Gammaproteobacteria bacterium]
MKTTRRETTKLILGTLAAVPVADLLARRAQAQAQEPELPHLSEDDAQAKTLMYHNDATKSPRVDKAGTPAAEQFCHNCMFLQEGEGQWRPCQIFPANTVNVDGWCLTWTLKPA